MMKKSEILLHTIVQIDEKNEALNIAMSDIEQSRDMSLYINNTYLLISYKNFKIKRFRIFFVLKDSRH